MKFLVKDIANINKRNRLRNKMQLLDCPEVNIDLGFQS